jgi:hypothetical protein
LDLAENSNKEEHSLSSGTLTKLETKIDPLEFSYHRTLKLGNIAAERG